MENKRILFCTDNETGELYEYGSYMLEMKFRSKKQFVVTNCITKVKEDLKEFEFEKRFKRIV